MGFMGQCWRLLVLSNGELEHRTALEQRRMRITLIIMMMMMITTITTTLSLVKHGQE
jgi:hypothetical protein